MYATSLSFNNFSCVCETGSHGCSGCPCEEVISVTPPVEPLVKLGSDEAMFSGIVNPEYDASAIVLAYNKGVSLRHCIFH